MHFARALTTLLACCSLLSAEEEDADYQAIIETKYQASLERLQILEYSPTTKVLHYDFELSGDKSWWGGFNVIEVDAEGSPLFWYDIPQAPTEHGIERVRRVTLSGRHYLEVIACTHQGNGSLYLYEVRSGGLHLLAKPRVMANLSSMHFSPTTASIEYSDVDGDGDQDLSIQAMCLKGPIIEKLRDVIGRYRRIYHYEGGEFVEQIQLRDGAPQLMD